ncbi:hypothetical protein KY330_02380 [Candidatus Woesearchaeota archaeon]|nr:hypothetical protein [Candidatus Woesearchaeota archaeon]
MKESNNCLIVGMGCTACRIPTFAKCWEKVRKEIQREAWIQLKDTEQFKKDREIMDNELKELNKNRM